jgi:membrane protein implicated in regulation of membrane protease activity
MMLQLAHHNNTAAHSQHIDPPDNRRMDFIACETCALTSLGFRSMGESAPVAAAAAAAAAPAASAAAPELIDGEPVLQALTAWLVAVVLVALLLDLLQTKARRSDARNRKKASLERLRVKVSAQQQQQQVAKRADDSATVTAADMQHADALQRQSTLCADMKTQPLVLPVMLAKKTHDGDDYPSTPPSSPPRGSSPDCEMMRPAGLQLTSSAMKEKGVLGDEGERRRPRPVTPEGGDPAFSCRLQLTTSAQNRTAAGAVAEPQGVRRREARRQNPDGGDPTFSSLEWRQPGWRPSPEWQAFRSSV